MKVKILLLLDVQLNSSLSARISVKLLNHEEAVSVCMITFADDLSNTYIAVGTAIIFEDEDTPRLGRILLYRYKSGHLHLVSEKEINGTPHAMLPFQNKLLVSVGSSVREEKNEEKIIPEGLF